jgi:hypothetical protein
MVVIFGFGQATRRIWARSRRTCARTFTTRYSSTTPGKPADRPGMLFVAWRPAGGARLRLAAVNDPDRLPSQRRIKDGYLSRPYTLPWEKPGGNRALATSCSGGLLTTSTSRPATTQRPSGSPPLSRSGVIPEPARDGRSRRYVTTAGKASTSSATTTPVSPEGYSSRNSPSTFATAIQLSPCARLRSHAAMLTRPRPCRDQRAVQPHSRRTLTINPATALVLGGL